MDLDTAAWDKMLLQTLDDGRLSTSERTVLREKIKDAALDDRNRALLRSRVFEIARENLNGDRYSGIVDRLEELSELASSTASGSNLPPIRSKRLVREGLFIRASSSAHATAGHWRIWSSSWFAPSPLRILSRATSGCTSTRWAGGSTRAGR